MDNQALPEVRQRENLLYDFYGGLLTQKQRDVFLLRHIDDNSLTEIGEAVGITPQSVVDTLKRATANLNRYEQLLGLVGKHEKQYTALAEIKQKLEEIEVKTVKPEINLLIFRTLDLIDSVI